MIKKIITAILRQGKVLILIISLFVQLFFIYAIVDKLYTSPINLYWSIYFVCIMLIFKILYDEDAMPAYKISWITSFFIFNSLSIVLFFIFGKNKFNKKDLLKVNQIKNKNSSFYTQNKDVYENILSLPAKKQCDLIFNLEQFPVYKNTNVLFLPTGESFLEKLIYELNTAKKFIFMEYFIVSDGYMHNKIMNVLKRKASEGVEVKYLYDSGGSMMTIPKNFKKECLKYNIQVEGFSPLNHHFYKFFSFRDHKKITVIDGLKGFTGGINIGDEYINKIEKYGHWKDSAVFLEGDAVYGLTGIFLSTWNYTSGDNLHFKHYSVPKHNITNNNYVIPFEDTPVNRTNIAEDNYIKIISSATKYIYITTPYLIINDHMSKALQLASNSGVDVRILTPHIPDKKLILELTRSFYSKLIRSGIKIYEYEPGFIHSKTIVSDDFTCVVGTINFDYRSLSWNYECACTIFEKDLAVSMKDDFIKTLEVSLKIDYKSSKSLTLKNKILYPILTLLGPLL